MTRPSRDRILMSMAHLIAERSTCRRRHVGAVLASEGRVLSTGYNGVPSGLPHCEHRCTCGVPCGAVHLATCPIHTPCTATVHAEANAVVWSARNGIGTLGTFLYGTDEPCLECAKLIINAGIVRVRYDRPYRVHDGLELLTRAGIDVGRFNYHECGESST